MRDRGYPADDRNASMDALSVYHAGSLEGYRQTLALRTESATTEQLREAMIRHRALFEDLTGLRDGHGQPERDRVAEIRDRAANRDVPDNNVAGNNVAGHGLAGGDNDLAAENGTRTADTPR
jgi:hypothetical protein